MRGTLGHQILENFDVAVGSGGVPGSVRSDLHWEDSEVTIRRGLSHIGVYVNGSGAFGDKSRPDDKEREKRI